MGTQPTGKTRPPQRKSTPDGAGLGVLLGMMLTTGLAASADLDVGSGQTYATIQAAVDAATAGDVVRVHAGTYPEDLDLTTSGSSGSPITIRGAIDGDATVGGQVTIDGDWWVIEDLFVAGQAGTDTIRLRGDHNRLQRLDVSGGDRDGIDGAGVDNQVRESRIHHFDSSSDAHCIVLNPGAQDWIIADNELFDCAGDGVQLYASGFERTIVNTRIEGNSIYFTGAVQRTENAIDVKNADGLIIHNNLMWGFPDNKIMVFQKGPIDIDVQCNVMHTGFTGVEFRAEDGGTVENVVFSRNLMHDYSEYALKFDGTQNAQVFHNTFVDIGNDGLRIEAAGLDGGNVQNNLWVRTGTVEAGNFTADHNGFWNVASNDIASGTDVTADPLLDADYHLSAGSPMIDAGVDVGLSFSGSAPDIGFYEVGLDACEPAGTGGTGGSGTGGTGTGGTGTGGTGTGGTGTGGTGTGGGGLSDTPGASPDDEGGCGCRLAPRQPRDRLTGWLLGAALAIGRRRRTPSGSDKRTRFPRHGSAAGCRD